MLVVLVHAEHRLLYFQTGNTFLLTKSVVTEQLYLNLVCYKTWMSFNSEFFSYRWMHSIDELKQSLLNGWRGTDHSITDDAFVE